MTMWWHVPVPPSRSPGALPPATETEPETTVVSTTTPRPGLLVVRAIGEIDLSTAPPWRRSLADALEVLTGRPDADGGLVCDLSSVTFLGASGLAVLVDLVEQAREHRVALCTVVTTRRVARVLRFGRLDTRLAPVDRLDTAVARLARGRRSS